MEKMMIAQTGNATLNGIHVLATTVFDATYQALQNPCGDMSLLEAMNLGKKVFALNNAMQRLTREAGRIQDRINAGF